MLPDLMRGVQGEGDYYGMPVRICPALGGPCSTDDDAVCTFCQYCPAMDGSGHSEYHRGALQGRAGHWGLSFTEHSFLIGRTGAEREMRHIGRYGYRAHLGPLGPGPRFWGGPPHLTPPMAASPRKVNEIGGLRDQFHFHF